MLIGVSSAGVFAQPALPKTFIYFGDGLVTPLIFLITQEYEQRNFGKIELHEIKH